MDYTIYAQAVAFACEVHRGQKRSEFGRVVNYVVHPLRVAEHLRHRANCNDVEILCAAVLHDTIEDSGVRYDEIAESFGDRVARIVAEVTNDSRLPKQQRHEAMIHHLATASTEAKLIKLADRYDNVWSVSSADPAKFERILRETPRLLESLRGTCQPLESAIESLLQSKTTAAQSQSNA